MTAQFSGAMQEWKSHWTLVLASAVGFSFTSFLTAAIGVFMLPLSNEFGWSRMQLSSGIALSGLISMLLSPFFGILIDRLGTRRLALAGLVLSALAIAAFSQANGSIVQWIGLWLVWGLCSVLIQSTVWSTAVAGTFSAGRGLALGLTLSGAAGSTIIAPPLTYWLIGLVGWRTTFVWLGLGWGSVALLLALLFLYDAHDRAAAVSAAGETGVAKADLAGLSPGEAWRNSALWRVAIATFLILLVTIAVVVHQYPILVEAGVPSATAAWLVSLSGVAGIVGKVMTGSLIDRFHARLVGGITLASTAIAYPLMMQGLGATSLIVIGIMISGYAAGTKIQLCAYLTARYAGMRNYGKIFGFMTSVIALASAMGPLLAGTARDHFGNYTPLLLVGVVFSIIAGGLVFTLGDYPEWRNQTTTAD